MTSFRGVRRAILVAVAFVLASCDGTDDDGPTGTIGSFTITVTPATLSLARGATGFISVLLTRAGGFNGEVSLSITGLPTGVSVMMDPSDLPAGTTQARINLSVSSTAALATSDVTITGSSAGRQASLGFSLTIVPAPDYTLSLTPGALTIAAGSSTQATLNIARSNFEGVVALELLDAPAGVIWGFTPTPAGLNTSSLSIAVGANVPPGNYPIRIRGYGSGVPERFALFQLTVTPQPTGGVGLDYSFCDPNEAPEFFAYQDGTGAWQRVTAVTAGGVVRFPFNLTSNLGGVLAVYRIRVGVDLRIPRRHDPAVRGYARRIQERLRRANRPRGVMADIAAPLTEIFVTDVQYATRAEFVQEAAQSCARSFPTKTVTGTVVGVPPGQYGIVALGGSGRIFDGASGSNVMTFTGVQSGLVDFFGTRTTPGQAPDRAVMFRNLNPADNGQLPQTIDFGGPASFQPAAATVTITNGLGHVLEVYTAVHTATSNVGFWNDLAPTTNATRPWAGLNAANTIAGDFHSITVFASQPNEGGNFRATVKFVGAVTNETIAFGSIANAATASLVSGPPYPRFRFQGTLPADYNKAVGLSMAQDEGNEFYSYFTTAYLAAIGSASTYDVTMPDVAGLTGFPIASRLAVGPNGLFTDAYGFVGAGVFDVVPRIGNEFKASFRTIEIVVP